MERGLAETQKRRTDLSAPIMPFSLDGGSCLPRFSCTSSLRRSNSCFFGLLSNVNSRYPWRLIGSGLRKLRAVQEASRGSHPPFQKPFSPAAQR